MEGDRHLLLGVKRLGATPGALRRLVVCSVLCANIQTMGHGLAPGSVGAQKVLLGQALGLDADVACVPRVAEAIDLHCADGGLPRLEHLLQLCDLVALPGLCVGVALSWKLHSELLPDAVLFSGKESCWDTFLYKTTQNSIRTR